MMQCYHPLNPLDILPHIAQFTQIKLGLRLNGLIIAALF